MKVVYLELECYVSGAFITQNIRLDQIVAFEKVTSGPKEDGDLRIYLKGVNVPIRCRTPKYELFRATMLSNGVDIVTDFSKAVKA